MHVSQGKFEVDIFVVPHITCDLPLHPIPFNSTWDHFSNIDLADPDFRRTGRIDLLLDVDIFTEVLLQGWWSGPPGSPVTWVLAGQINPLQDKLPVHHICSHHVMSYSTDDMLRKFYEVKEHHPGITLTSEKYMIVHQFDRKHLHDKDEQFIVSLPRWPDAKPILL